MELAPTSLRETFKVIVILRGWVKIGGYRLSEIAIKISDTEMDISENDVIKKKSKFPIGPKMDI